MGKRAMRSRVGGKMKLLVNGVVAASVDMRVARTKSYTERKKIITCWAL